ATGVVQIVIVIGSDIYILPFPFLGDFTKLDGDGFPGTEPVTFCKAFVSTTLHKNGTVQILPNPTPILIIQDGVYPATTWLGTGFPATALATTQVDPPPLDPTNTDISPFNIPIGQLMQWSGDRLWVASGNKLHASDFGDPLHFYEETYVAGGGALI